MENFVVAAVAFSIVYAVLTVAGNWLLFRKAWLAQPDSHLKRI